MSVKRGDDDPPCRPDWCELGCGGRDGPGRLARGDQDVLIIPDTLTNKMTSFTKTWSIDYSYHPHVTVAHDLPDEALYRVLHELSGYDALFQVWGFSLFEQGPDLHWRPQRDFAFSSGGLPGPREERYARTEAGR